jgi:hypothetical protein
MKHLGNHVPVSVSEVPGKPKHHLKSSTRLNAQAPRGSSTNRLRLIEDRLYVTLRRPADDVPTARIGLCAVLGTLLVNTLGIIAVMHQDRRLAARPHGHVEVVNGNR